MQRIKGQETELVVIVDGKPQRTLVDIREFEIEWQLEKKSEGYLGETTNRKDSIFMGVAGSFSMHLENEGIFDFISKVIDRARDRTAGTKINIKTTLRFPNGDRPKIIIPDAEFGAIPLNAGGRAEYLGVKLDFEASEASVIS